LALQLKEDRSDATGTLLFSFSGFFNLLHDTDLRVPLSKTMAFSMQLFYFAVICWLWERELEYGLVEEERDLDENEKGPIPESWVGIVLGSCILNFCLAWMTHVARVIKT
jgi:hypothetical protein